MTAATPQDYAVWLPDHITSQDNVKEVQSNFMLREGKSQGAMPLQNQ